MPINSINTFYSTVWVPKCSSIILCQFEDHRSDALPKMTQSGKHGIFRGTFRGIFSKVLKLILDGPNGPNIPFYEFEDRCKCYLADMTQSGKHRIFDKILYNMLINSINTFYSTVWVPNYSSINSVTV